MFLMLFFLVLVACEGSQNKRKIDRAYIIHRIPFISVRNGKRAVWSANLQSSTNTS